MLPHIKAVKDQIRCQRWLSARRSRLLHKCMSFVMQAATAVCAAPFVARCCDTLHREVRPFISFYILDGAEQYAHTLCGTTQCPRGDVPRDDLDNTERVCRTRKVRVLKAALLKARAEMWDDAAGKPKPGQGKKVAEWQRTSASIRFFRLQGTETVYTCVSICVGEQARGMTTSTCTS
jgi:hypothetical protein